MQKAIDNDEINLGFHVKGPEDYINNIYLKEIDDFIEKNEEYSAFFDKVAYYFDAKSHNFDAIQNIPIAKYVNRLHKVYQN